MNVVSPLDGLKNKYAPFWILTIAVFLFLTCSALVQNGMFIDGVIYSSISRNLSQHIGEWWAPQYTQTIGNPMFDQPPFVYYLLSFFFKIAGDHLFVERFYSLLTAILTGFIIVKLWFFVFRKREDLKAYAWLPVLFWISTPIVFWSYANNMMENTMCLFDLLAIYSILLAIESGGKKWIHLVLCSFFVFLAFDSKGPASLFPLVGICIYAISIGGLTFSSAFKKSLIIILLFMLFFSLPFLLEPKFIIFFSEYLNKQVFSSIHGKRELAETRFYLLQRLPSELLPMALLIVLVFWLKKFMAKSAEKKIQNQRFHIFFLFVACSASLPILISPKNAGFYLVPSIPYFAMAAGIFTVPIIHDLFQSTWSKIISSKIVMISSLTLLSCSMFYCMYRVGKPGKNQDLILLTQKVARFTSPRSLISACPETFQNWGVHAYLMRYNQVSLDSSKLHPYLLTEKKCKSELLVSYTLVDTSLKDFNLMKLKEKGGELK